MLVCLDCIDSKYFVIVFDPQPKIGDILLIKNRLDYCASTVLFLTVKWQVTVWMYHIWFLTKMDE